MTELERLMKLARDTYQHFGSFQKMGDYLGVSRQQAHRITTGESEPTGHQVVKMQDLLRKVAAVLITVGISAFSSPQDANATESAPYSAIASRTLCIMLNNGCW